MDVNTTQVHNVDSKKMKLSHQSSSRQEPKRFFLFDVDGTLTVPRKKISPEMAEFLNKCKKHAHLGIVGGSDIAKQKEQLGENVIKEWEYIFSENGLDAYKHGELLHRKSFSDFLGEDKIQGLLSPILHYIADLDIPVKRGTFIEYRNGMLNVSPIGRDCSRKERENFYSYDKVHKVREKMIEALSEEFKKYGLQTSIGGQISFDVFPYGWDKTYCLPFLEKDGFTEIHFFGDKTWKGGNDYEIYSSPKTIGHKVECPADTQKILTKILGLH